MVRQGLGAILLVLVGAGCADSVGDGGAEAGSEGPVWEASESWTVEVEPSLVIQGSAEDEYLTRVPAAWTAEDRVVVANFRSPPALRAYDLQGSLLWRVEGEGDGPGEFRAVVRAWPWPGDRVTAYDPFGGGLTSVDSEGGDPQVTRLDWLPGTGMISTVLLGPVNDSTLIARPNVGALPEGVQEGRVMEPLFRLNTAARSWDTLRIVPRWDLFIDSEGRSSSPLFGRSNAIATGRGKVVWGMGDDYTLHEVSVTDGEERTFGRGYEARPVTDALADSLRLRRLSRLSGPQAETMRAGVERWFREAPRADVLPAYDKILLGPDDQVWVRNYLAPGDPVEVWSVFDGERRWLGEVEMPPGLEATDVSAEWVTGVVVDEFDVPHVQVHRLVRP